MPVEIQDAAARFLGTCVVEEAETLLEWLRVTPDAAVDLSACEAAHSALLQLLLAAAPSLSGAPPDPVLAAALVASARNDPTPR